LKNKHRKIELAVVVCRRAVGTFVGGAKKVGGYRVAHVGWMVPNVVCFLPSPSVAIQFLALAVALLVHNNDEPCGVQSDSLTEPEEEEEEEEEDS
jgi:hypothetical protein